jgi:hypothetical protein
LAAVARGVDRRHHRQPCRGAVGAAAAAAAFDGGAGRVCGGAVADGMVVSANFARPAL